MFTIVEYDCSKRLYSTVLTRLAEAVAALFIGLTNYLN